MNLITVGTPGVQSRGPYRTFLLSVQADVWRWKKAAALPPLAPQTIYVDGRDGGGGGGGFILPRGRRRNEGTGEVIPNPRPIQCLRILSGENTREICRYVDLPTLGGVAFCKRCHMGYTCFGDGPRAASNLHPAGAIVDEVATVMAADRAAREATAAPT